MAKKDSHFIASPYKVVTEYENEFISEFNDNLSGAVSEILKYVAKKTNSALKGSNVIEKSLSDDLKLAAKNTNTSPSEAEIKAGNYKKGDLTFFGLPIKIENPKGSVRSGVDKDGTPWSVKMNNDYGYIKGTKGKDGDHVDVFFGDSDTSDLVFVIDQFVDGKFDEHKVMLGFDDAISAKDAYLSNYSKDWKGLKKIVSTDIKKFKKWINVKTKKQKPYHQYINKSENTDIEKAHNIGDIHPNGKWKWTQLPSGKYDWRNIPKKEDKQTQPATDKTNNVYDDKSLEDLLSLKKELYSVVDIESPKTKDEKLLESAIADKFSKINKEIARKRLEKEINKLSKESQYVVSHFRQNKLQAIVFKNDEKLNSKLAGIESAVSKGYLRTTNLIGDGVRVSATLKLSSIINSQ